MRVCYPSLHKLIHHLIHRRAIHTYQNQGIPAHNVHARSHIVIYSGEQPPALVPGEDEVILKRDAIKVILDPRREPLLPTSRLNLAKIYTVEHS
jgi:uncharacterized protein DUF6590